MQYQCSDNVVPMQYQFRANAVMQYCLKMIMLALPVQKKGKFWVNDDGKRETPEAVETNQKMPKTEI